MAQNSLRDLSPPSQTLLLGLLALSQVEWRKGKQSGRAKRVGKKLMEVGKSFNPLAWQWIFSDGMPVSLLAGALLNSLDYYQMAESTLVTDEWFGSTVNSLSLASIMLQEDSLNVRSSFDAAYGVGTTTLPSCSSPVRMQESPFPTSSSSQESLVNLIQPVGRHKQVKRKRDSSSGLLVYLENSDDREERLQEQGQAMLKEQSQAMLQEVHVANAEFLRVSTESSRTATQCFAW
ncbi:hypothetical protein F7725_013003 [Dissostichus mawsoni]|uniref:Uncharacterized protein n=1 Tax=Dissostichus mawsoni TaxID=36200 RepID=A0A7J5YQL8_DISMA|nr:hypothetical protein F7725_013003 [Dissostichus mawsoni]